MEDIPARIEVVGRRRRLLVQTGGGFPEGFDPKRHAGLGLRIIRSLADQLQADWV